MFAALALAALLIEAAVGYPQVLVQRIGHPVMWMGALIAWADGRWNRDDAALPPRRARGIGLVLVLVAGMMGIGLAVTWAMQTVAGAPVATMSLGCWRAACSRSAASIRMSRPSPTALETEGLAGGRRAVAMIVGRNPDGLDEAGVARAAIESLAENFSDGVVAPLFWLALGGLPGGALYKAINTADSMIGHRTPAPSRLRLGRGAARRSRQPAGSRLSALWLSSPAAFVDRASPRGARWRAVRRDARQHRSPNAGWPEAAMAGALGLRLAGPRVYRRQLVDDAWMGDGRARPRAADIRARPAALPARLR